MILCVHESITVLVGYCFRNGVQRILSFRLSSLHPVLHSKKEAAALSGNPPNYTIVVGYVDHLNHQR